MLENRLVVRFEDERLVIKRELLTKAAVKDWRPFTLTHKLDSTRRETVYVPPDLVDQVWPGSDAQPSAQIFVPAEIIKSLRRPGPIVFIAVDPKGSLPG